MRRPFGWVCTVAAVICCTIFHEIEAGVLGPVVGVVGALQADLALAVIDGMAPFGSFVAYDGLRDTVRRHRVPVRPSCTLCSGDHGEIRTLDPARYMPQDSCV